MRSVLLVLFEVLCYLSFSLADLRAIENNPDHTESGKKIYFGDVLLSNEQERLVKQKMAVVTGQRYRWPTVDGYPTISYYVDHPDPKVQALITEVVKHYSDKTCIRWREVDRYSPTHKVKFYQGSGCWSFVGKIDDFYPAQNLSIGPGCETFHTIAHEMGHASGMWHTQQGTDRDNYVYIDFNNISPGKESNFEYAEGVTTYDIPYDYYSVMHYGYWAFSIDGRPTIISKNIEAQYLMGTNAEGLIFTDAKALNLHYKCIDEWKQKCSLTSDYCRNGGYIGSNCKCVCPSNYDGTHCDSKTGPVYPRNRDCGGNVTSSTYIDSPDLRSIGHDRDCSWWIQAPRGMVPKVTIAYRNLYPSCKYNILTFRKDNLYTGPSYCSDNEIQNGFTVVGSRQDLVLHFVSWYSHISVAYLGFSAQVQFIPNPNI